jgi:hypothetical protein
MIKRINTFKIHLNNKNKKAFDNTKSIYFLISKKFNNIKVVKILVIYSN